MVAVTGTPETPTKTGIPNADIAATSILSALFRRGRTGQGAVVDVSMFDSAVEWMGYPLYMHLYRQIPRMELTYAAIAPYDSYPTADGQILIGVQNDRGRRTLVSDVFASPTLADDPRFTTNVKRVRHRTGCDAAVAGHTRRWTTSDLDDRLAAAGIPAAQINGTAELVELPPLHERDRWRTVSTEAGDGWGLLPPMNFRDVELPMGAVPALGERNERILSELGLTDDTSTFPAKEPSDA